MIELCIDARMAECSGIGTCIRNIVPLLNRPPFKLTLLVDKKGASWCHSIPQIQVTASIYSIQEQVALPFQIPKCDLFWSPHYNIPLLPIRARKRVVTIHDACHLALSQYLSLPERLYAKFVMKKAYLKSDAVVTDSYFSKTELQHYLGSTDKKIDVIPMAVSHESFQRVTDQTKLNSLRSKYQLPGKFLLYVGNLKPHKNLAGLLKAFSQASLAGYHLVLVGKFQGLRHAIEKVSQENVLILENLPDADLPAVYSMATCLVLPSFYEGFGLPPLEAMCAHCPTLVSHAASLPEVCGNASLYFDPAKPEDIAKKITHFLSDEKMQKQLIAKGLEQVQSYRWQKTAEKYAQLFMRML